MEHYLRLAGSDAGWFQSRSVDIPTSERYRLIALAHEMLGISSAPTGTTWVGMTETGTVLCVEVKDGETGTVRATVLGEVGGIRARFRFTPQYPSTSTAAELSDLVWDAGEHGNEALSEAPLSAKLTGYLTREEIHTVGQLVARTPAEILDIRGIGDKSLVAIREWLRTLGIDWGETAPY